MPAPTSFEGLTHAEAKENIALYGKNVLTEQENNGVVLLFLRQFLSPFIYILLTVAGISILTQNYTDAIVIAVVLVINAIVGTYQEYRATNAIKALKRLTHTKNRVIREDDLVTVRTDEVTIDDVVYLESGDIIPADGDTLRSEGLSVNESQMTGESIPVLKAEGEFLYKSSVVTSGSGYMKVTKVGMQTFIGDIAENIAENSAQPTELSKKISHFSVRLLGVLAVVVALFTVFSLYRGLPLTDTLTTSVALAVAVVPEGLPIVLTVVLSLGALHISRAKALLRNLHSGSTLASVSTICTDKTGTLTHGDLSVKEIVTLDTSFAKEDIAAYLYHSLDIKTINGKKVGDTLELALDTHVGGTFSWEETKEAPFTSEKKYNAKEYRIDNEFVQLYKGAPEKVGVKESVILPYVQEGFRVIALTYTKRSTSDEFDPSKSSPLALVIFEDKIRLEAKSSIEACKRAGISVMMITGDNIITAEHVAKEVGIAVGKDHLVIVGEKLDDMTDEELRREVHRIKVIARANPLHKERIVRALQENGEVVAMTGDGVNDGPALSLANIGISMGKSGTEVAKGASDLVLVEDDFSDIVLAIFEARTISENIRKTLTFLMVSATSIVIATLGSVFFSLPLPFLAAQIIWLNFVTAGFLDFAIATEPSEQEFRVYTYHRYTRGLLNRYDIARVAVLGTYIGLVTLFIFHILIQASSSVELARTGAMFLVSAFIWFNALNARRTYATIFSFNPLSNVFVSAAIVFEVIILLLSIYLVSGNMLFSTTWVKPELLLFLASIALSIFVLDTLYKLVAKAYRRTHGALV